MKNLLAHFKEKLRNATSGCPRAHELFQEGLHEVYVRTDHFFACLMIFQWLVGIGFSLWISPQAWSGATSSVHPHVLLAVFVGGAITSLPLILIWRRPGSLTTRLVVAVGQTLTSALLIHLLGGRIETHFHVFGSLAFLAFYRDWRVLIVASTVVALDHFLRGLYFPMSVYGELTGVQWRWLEHASWVVFMDILLFIGMRINLQELRATADRQALLEHANLALREATDVIEQKTHLLNSVLTNMGEGVVAADPQGHFMLFNPAAQSMLGETPLGMPVENWTRGFKVYAEDGVTPYPVEALPLARALRGESVDSVELLIDNKAQPEPLWIEASARPLRADDGRLSGGLVVLREITERRRLMAAMQKAQENAERANLAKSEFLSRMSHELRTPLNSVIGFAQLTEMDESRERCKGYTARIMQAGHHLLRLINEILDIARIESGNMSFSSEPVVLNELLEQSVALVAPLAEKRKINIVVEGDADETYVKADRQRLSQILLNLLSNAIKYNREGGVVNVTVSKTKHKATVTVTDTGPGVPDEHLHKLFQPFERLGADDQTVEGTGLGLALSKGLAEAMGGSLYLKGNSSAGASFELSLNTSAPPAQIPEQLFKNEDLLLASGVATILLVEDNPANIHLMRGIFDMLPGTNLHVAQEAAEGVRLAKELRPDLILLDVHLPDESGAWVLESIRDLPECQKTSVLVVSADATDTQRERLLASGAIAYITKPVNVPEFLAVVEGLLAKLRPAA
ncbi:MAG: hypothetical protein QOJ65_2746 [Fimbriimonadaceae bacterium]|jgi:PAS domain S-box-containing protein|nr:hypothetical protein [Fimbriimonadaceae bacterium]